MKKNIILSLFTILPFLGMAQSETLLGGELRFGGFGGPNVELGFIDGQAAFYSGGSGAMIVNGKFIVGGFGQGLISEHIIDPFEGSAIRPAVLSNRVSEIQQGGFWLGYIHKPTKLWHLHGGLQMGGGEVDFYDQWNDSYSFEGDGFLALRPYIGVELNIAKFMKISASGGYQFVTGLNNYYLNNSDLSQPFVNLGFKFGFFNEG